MFNQHFENVHGDVINVAGDYNLTKNSSHSDFVAGLEALQLEVNKLKNLSAENEQLIKEQIASAIEASKDTNTSKSSVASKLNSVKTTLDAVKDSVEGASALGITLGQLAGWVVKTAKFFI